MVGDDETGAGACNCGGEWRALPSPRYDEPCAVRRIVRALLGLADRGATLRAGQQVALVGAGQLGPDRRLFIWRATSTGCGGSSAVGILEASMSRYLVERFKAHANIAILTGPTVTALEGHDGHLKAVSCRTRAAPARR